MENAAETPKFENGSWTCPPGYAHPKCPGCGHNFYGGKPSEMVNGRAVSGGLCHWCVEEE